ncbi:glycosyltransferase family 4 protein [Anthocerotibacter panamensis]|uniref:glycosyltransferase family 4 protein n=1 Tax=Anthocerotibacter panamensis TaxID=2857077 RepID=UPI001C40455F|nr:glycosyltransferase family 1 protein [Anthocerotibacter panamensis]
MRKLIINGSFLRRRITGGQRYAREITACLLHNFDDVAVSWSDPTHPEIPSDRIHYVPKSAGTRVLGSRFWNQFDLVRSLRSNVLWSPENIGPLGVKNHAVTVLDLSALEHPEWFNPEFAAMYSFYLPLLVRQAKIIFTISQYCRNRILDRFSLPEEKVVVSPCAVSQRFQPAADQEVVEVRRRYSLPESYILSLGSLEPRKNLVNLFKAWALLPNKITRDIGLVIAGERGAAFAQPNYTSLLGQLNNVTFTGYFPDKDLPILYSGALGLVYPSLYEGFGLPPLEAMACGTPVITCNNSSLPEVVGQGALFVDPLNSGSIAEAIENLILDQKLAAELSAYGLKRTQMFSWDISANVIHRKICDCFN